LYFCTIITTEAAELMQPIHDRMPVIIPQSQYDQWLDKTEDGNQAYNLIDSVAYADMTATSVCDWVNNPQHDDNRCTAQI
jgi:putative SOS response-associated peptidase YedK